MRLFLNLRFWLFLFILLAVSVAAAVFFLDPILKFYEFLTDREAVGSVIESWGAAAPIAFMGLQVLQVMLAPLPGEISGFVGGYLFGAVNGFIYSSMALAAGSALNFWIGRFVGYRFIRKLIPEDQLEKMDMFMARQGIILGLVFFIFPGFPKDYLSLFLGGTSISFKLFIILAGLGRMPGTMMLSLQGGLLFEKMYVLYAAVLGVSLAAVALAVYYRKALYAWAEKFYKR